MEASPILSFDFGVDFIPGIDLNSDMPLKPESILLVKIVKDQEDYVRTQNLLERLGTSLQRALLILGAQLSQAVMPSKVLQLKSANSTLEIQRWLEVNIHHFSHLLFLDEGKMLSIEALQCGIGLIQADPMIAGFQYAWNPAPAPYLIPFLAKDIFCVKRGFVVDFGLESDETLLESSYRANQSGYRFLGIPEVAGNFVPDFSPAVHARMPYLAAIIKNHVESQDFGWNQFHSAFHHVSDRRSRILFDLAHFVGAYNGTTICGLNLLKRFYQFLEVDRDVTLCCTEEVRKFIQKEVPFSGWKWLTPQEAEKQVFEMAFVLGHPWQLERIKFLNQNCYSVFFLILDSIAWDCLYIRQGFPDLDRLWKYWAEFSSGLLFISKFSETVFLQRFPLARRLPHYSCLLSTSHEDYLFESLGLELKTQSVLSLEKDSYYLIFGNFYKHKFIQPTLELIQPLLMETEKVVVVGSYGAEPQPGIMHLNSGSFSQEEICSLYGNAKAVFYPSQFEGFGLPIAEALAQDKVIFARDTDLLRELMDSWTGPGSVLPFTDNLDLVEKFRKFQVNEHELLVLKGKLKDPDHDWMSVSHKMLGFVEVTHASKENNSRVENRFRTSDLFKAFSKNGCWL